MDLINRTRLLKHIDECIAESLQAQSPIIKAVLMAIKCAVEQMPRVDGIEWHKVTKRQMTEADYDRICASEFIPNDVFLCDMPKDGQKILVATPWGTELCRCIKSYSVIYGASWLDVIAWAELPKYEEG